MSAWPTLNQINRQMTLAGRELASFVTRPVERRWARRNQERYCNTFIAVTGSCGKSTTTYLVGRLLSPGGKRVVTGLYDNTPRWAMRALRRLDGPVEYVVQEVSGHAPGSIGLVTSALRIDVAVVTMVGLDHRARYRTAEAVAAEKGKLVSAIGVSGIACLNADDPLVHAMASRSAGRVVLYGRAAIAEVRAEQVTAAWPARLCFTLVVGDRRLAVRTRFVGTVMITNILAALAVVHAMGHDIEPAVAALADLEPLGDRLGVVSGTDQHTYLVDTYKAPFWITKRLFEDLPNWGAGRRIVVLGDMSDLGSDNFRKYRQMLRKAGAASALAIGVGQAASQARILAAEFPNIVPAGSLQELRAILHAQSASLVLLKSNKTYPLGEILTAGPEPL
ncbi:MAG TPA: Mur ligase family protein [Frankiaceae bacterium]|nr:Mur ligase family protein [Frankiaceae bacterium]